MEIIFVRDLIDDSMTNIIHSYIHLYSQNYSAKYWIPFSERILYIT